VLGGWAVYKIVNESFRRNNGRDYLGSRDIDLGFHIDANASTEDLKKSDLAAAVNALKSDGFEAVGFRLVKHFDIDSRKELTPEEAKQKPSGGQTTQIFGKTVILPLPHLLLATKFRSMLNRDKEHKMIKDLADIYALAWHSPTRLDTLKRQIEPIVNKEARRKVLMDVTPEHVDLVSRATGVDTSEIQRVLAELMN